MNRYLKTYLDKIKLGRFRRLGPWNMNVNDLDFKLSEAELE